VTDAAGSHKFVGIAGIQRHLILICFNRTVTVGIFSGNENLKLKIFKFIVVVVTGISYNFNTNRIKSIVINSDRQFIRYNIVVITL
jgi:hypothetical protein